MKKCYKCQLTKDAELFYKNRSTKDGLSGLCKQCSGEHERENNKLTKEWVWNLKDKCIKCNDTRKYVLDFHHVDKKLKTIDISNYSISGTASFITKKNKILDEIKNCVVLCSNCHREFHYLEKNNNITFLEYINYGSIPTPGTIEK